MEITYIGHSCFKIKDRDVSLVFDPFDPEMTGLKLPKLEASIVCVSHQHKDHNFVEGVSGGPFVISGPGEYDIKGVTIRGISTFHDDKEGKERGKNTMYYVEIDGLFVLHLGDLGFIPSKEIWEDLGDVDVLLIPVGGTYTIDYKQAAEIVSELEPSYVIPMHYKTEKSKIPSLEPLDKFLNEMGSEGVRKEPKLKLSGKTELPNETQVVVLEQS